MPEAKSLNNHRTEKTENVNWNVVLLG